MSNTTKVEVIYALSKEQQLYHVVLEQGDTVQQAIKLAGVLETYPDLDLQKHSVGIWGKVVELSSVVLDGARIEIYRPLTIDPKEARRVRASNT